MSCSRSGSCFCGKKSSSSICPGSASSSCRSYSDTPDKKLRKIRAHCPKKTKCYRLTAELLPDKCLCMGGVACSAQNNTVPNCTATAGSINSSVVTSTGTKAGSGRAKFTLRCDPNNSTADLTFNVSYAKLSPNGWSPGQPSTVTAVLIRGPSRNCSTSAGIVVNCSAIYQLATNGEPLDSYVTGKTTIDLQKAKELCKGYWTIVVMTQNFNTCEGELRSRISPVRFNKCDSSSSSSSGMDCSSS